MAAEQALSPGAGAGFDPRLARLLEVVMRLAAGDLSARVEITGDEDELDAIGLGLNMLAEELEMRQRGLEQLVEQRTNALQAATAELERSNAELEQFAYVASHDLQEPLRMVSSYAQLLSKRYQGQLDADADEFIGFAVDGAKRMQALIADMLAYARVGSRLKEGREVELDQALERCLANLEFLIAETGTQIEAAPLPVVIGDESQLVQLFQNLIANAVKFRSGPPLVRIGAERAGDWWVISVADNGIGIDPQFGERIFAVFQRLHSGAEYEGTGIGLAVCKKIVERMGGRIWVESAPGLGSTFKFTIKVTEAAGG